MKRIDFLKTSLSAAALAALPNVNLKAASSESEIIKPKKLNKGDTLGLIAPGSFISQQELEEATATLQGMGYNVVPSKNVLNRYGYLGGKDEERAADVMEMFENKDIDAIICARGGYGCARILPLLDYDVIKDNPKILTGYSDITALLYGIFAKTGLVCFHGPVGISTFNEFTTSYFNDTLFYTLDNLKMVSVPEKTDSAFQPKTIVGGSGEGKLVGGNLSIVVSMIGTEYDIDTKDKIVFLEEVGEDPYRIDRMFTQMIQAGKFKDAAGIAMGVFSNCEAKRGGEFSSSLSREEVIFDRLGGLDIPIVYGLSFGHISNKFTLPFGINASLDADEKILTLLESSVL